MPSRVVSNPVTGEETVIEMTPEEVSAHAVSSRGSVQWSNDEAFRKRTQSVGITPTEIYRVELLQLTGYSINVTVMGVDNGNGAIKKQTGDYTLERLNAAPILIGETLSTPHQSAAASTWKIDRSFVTENGKTYGVITVTGAAGRTIDWLVKGTMFYFTPQVVEPPVTYLGNPPPIEVDREVPPDPADFPIGEPE